jgi:hypothetical protein
MKTSTKFALLFLAILLSACSITPKYHSLGYHIEWKHDFNQKEPRRTTKKIIAENNRESYSIALKSCGLTTPNPDYPKYKSLTPNQLEIRTPGKIDIARQTTSKPPQQTTYKSHQPVTEYSQTSDTPITTKQLRKLVPNPPMVVKINQQLQAIRVAILVFSTVFGCSFFLFLDGIFGNIYVDFNLVFIGLMISTLLLTILVPLESRLFRRRQKIMNELYVKNPEAIQLLKSLDSLYALLFLIPYLGTPIYHLIRHLTFKKLQSLEPNNPYIELRRRKTKWNVVPGYFSLILTIVSYMVILVL